MLQSTLKFRIFKSDFPISEQTVANYLSPLFSNKPNHIFLEKSEAPLKKGEPLLGVCLTGGSEAPFLKVAMENPHSPAIILTHNKANSFASGCELSARLNLEHKKGKRAPTIFCSIDDAKSLKSILNAASVSSRFVQKPPRLGIIGEPSPWLICSGRIAEHLPQVFHIQTKKISMKEFINKILDSKSVKTSLSQLIKKNNLDAFTIRCFDILPYKVTSCVEVSEFNDEGITATCEGDISSAVTMIILQSLARSPVFMANATGFNGDQMTFAHCTIPRKLCSDSSIKTHFESGLGKAICGKVKEGKWTMARIGADGQVMAELVDVKNPEKVSPDHCRTQIIVEMPSELRGRIRRGDVLGNHFMFVPGDIKDDIEYFTRFHSSWKN
ncbi:L-fucose isomerase [Histomonas meleagridis]|uniref:L-fucose isomerase n=1 Tax=Histomonas meleagridis TaxID=135588 RepID=UPI00355ACA17|nr:L-fucose isomerase [Histomonas meleagridis]KAH0800891.1 L-fucose isomerase [Histomonas meleagridis]